MNQKDFLDEKSLSALYQSVYNFIDKTGMKEYYSHIFTTIALLICSTIVLYLIDLVLRKIVLSAVKSFILRTKTKIDDLFLYNRVLDHLLHLIPLIIAKNIFPIIFMGFPKVIAFISKSIEILIVFMITLFLHAIFKSLRDLAKTKPSLTDKPLDSYLQVVSIFLYSICGVLIFTLLTGVSPKDFLISLGAASAILMLVFKDTIMGFVASIQVSTNDMIRVGDWIEMSKFGADGDVLEINLNTVKIQNFDKTITTIPTHLLITDSFKNYRGMQNSGGRRIKRSINLKISSIRFLEPEEIEELKKIQLLAPYIEERSKDIELFNTENNCDTSMPVNGRTMTNAGLFRAYAMRYAQQNPNIHKELTLMVRQLQPTEHGLPIELYMFTSDTRWTIYETVMADIFDHLLASIEFFKLEVFELPASDDLRSINKQ